MLDNMVSLKTQCKINIKNDHKDIQTFTGRFKASCEPLFQYKGYFSQIELIETHSQELFNG